MTRIQNNDQGVTLIETMIAVLVAFIAMASIGAVIFSSMVANKNQGTEGTRMTAFAQAKMESLLALSYGDNTTNTTLLTDTGWTVGLTSNAATNLNFYTDCASIPAADDGYTDFLDANGNPMTGSCATVMGGNYGYERRWKITDVISSTPGPGLKQITVVVYAPNAVNTNTTATTGSVVPSVALTSFKSQ